MKALNSFGTLMGPTISLTATATILSACSAVQQGSLPSLTTQSLTSVYSPTRNTNTPNGLLRIPSFHIENKLLYVSDAFANDVYVRTYPRNKTVGTLTGFNDPQGLCSDKNGNVWIANMANSSLLEYAHGGTEVIATLNDPGELPVACSIDSKSGNLAAVNFTTTGGDMGSIAIYKKAAGKPTVVRAFKMSYFDGYDRSGNLFVDGLGSSGTKLGEIVRGTSTVKELTVKGATINVPGGIQFALGSLAVGDQDINGTDAGIYEMAVSGDTAQVTGTVQLVGSQRSSAFVILGNTKRVLCADTTNGVVPIYNYPAGGKPIKVLKVVPTGSVNGIAISQTPPP